jgi:hypothetical protein
MTPERPEARTRPIPSDKVQGRHLERRAMVYVRQSTVQQVQRHGESTKLQYALVERAVQLGWARDLVLVVDDDLGRSGASAEGRPGFQRLVAEVSLGHVGLVLGIEMSRLARSCRDWHQLIEICALRDTLIADVDGVHDPASYTTSSAARTTPPTPRRSARPSGARRCASCRSRARAGRPCR